jgi:hypothetical protein
MNGRSIVVIIIILGMVVSNAVNFIEVDSLSQELFFLLLILAVIGAVGAGVHQFFPNWFEASTTQRERSQTSTSRSFQMPQFGSPTEFFENFFESVTSQWFYYVIMILFTIPSYAVANDVAYFSNEGIAWEVSLLFTVVGMTIIITEVTIVTYFVDGFNVQSNVISTASLGIAIGVGTVITQLYQTSLLSAFFIFLGSISVMWLAIFLYKLFLIGMGNLGKVWKNRDLRPVGAIYVFVASYIILVLISVFDGYRFLASLQL